MSLSADKIKKLIEICLNDCMKEAGYKKKGQTYFLNTVDMIKTVNIQSSRWNAMGFGSFTINLGIYVPAIGSIMYGKAIQNPKSYDCQISTRIGHLMPEKNDKWWSFGPETEVEKDSMGLREAWEKYGKPFLDQFKNLNDIKEYCASHNMLFQEAAICVVMGETDGAREKIRILLSTSFCQDSEYDEMLSVWVKNLGFSDLL